MLFNYYILSNAGTTDDDQSGEFDVCCDELVFQVIHLFLDVWSSDVSRVGFSSNVVN